MKPGNFLIQDQIRKSIEFLEKKNFLEAIKLINIIKKDKKTKNIGLFLNGIFHIKQKAKNEAKQCFNKILETEINHLEANLNLGLIFYDEKKYDKSEFYFNKVININYNQIDAHYHKALIFFDTKKYENSIECLNKCKEINSEFHNMYLLYGHIYREKKEFKKAIDNYKKFSEKNPNDNISRFNLSWCYFATSDLNNAFKFYEFRKEKTIPKTKTIEVKNKFNPSEWTGENINNKKILIISEQGIGDIIQFFRYLYCIKEYYNSEIIFYTDKNFKYLFKDTPFNIVSDLNSIANIDYYQNLLSLPGIFFKKNGKIQKCINYIKIEKIKNYEWKNKLSKYNKPIIALTWQGSQNYLYDSQRSIKLSNFEKIIKNEKFKFISLQKGYGSEQINKFNLSDFVTDLSSEIDLNENSFEDTIHILNNIDLLITSDTSIAHLAGTLNIKTLLLLSYNPDWRWYLETQSNVFYPSVKIIQQDNFDDWDSVFENVKYDLNKISVLK